MHQKCNVSLRAYGPRSSPAPKRTYLRHHLGAGPFKVNFVTDYNTLYEQEPDALGAPYAPLHASIRQHVPDESRFLDIGCGQGRDALTLARLGHHVVGMDYAPASIKAMQDNATAEGLSVNGVVGDLTEWTTSEMFDVLLCDRTLHMLPKQAHRDALARLIPQVSPNGFVFLVDEPSNMAGLKAVLTASNRHPVVLRETKGDYFVQLDQNESNS